MISKKIFSLKLLYLSIFSMSQKRSIGRDLPIPTERKSRFFRWICARRGLPNPRHNGSICGVLILVIPCIPIFIGCASYSMKAEEMLVTFSAGEQKDALEKVEKLKSKTSQLLYLVEKGTIQYYAKEFEASNKTFEEAELLSEELYTKSISREAASLLSSDNILPYTGEKFERAFINFYRAFNYVYLRKPEDALVECRKVNVLLQRYADQNAGKSSYSNDAFIQYLTGILYEWQGELNDAFISYRQAEEAYQTCASEFGIEPPSELKDALLRLSETLGFPQEQEYYLQKYGKDREYKNNPGWGELIVIHENGFVPKKVEENLVIPILKHEKIDKDTDLWEYSETLSARARSKTQIDKLKVQYLLRIAIPTYTSSRPQIAYMKVQVTPRLHQDKVRPDGIGINCIPEMGADAQTATSELVEDIELIAQRTFTQRQARILLKTIARALTKYTVFKTAEKKKGKAAGFLVNLFNVATESADTRSWLTLPNNIQMARLPLPAGTFELRLTFYDQDDRGISSTNIPNVMIKENDYTFLNYRTFQ